MHTQNVSLHTNLAFVMMLCLQAQPTVDEEQELFNWTKQWYPMAAVQDLDPAVPHPIKLLGIHLSESQHHLRDDCIPAGHSCTTGPLPISHRQVPWPDAHVNKCGSHALCTGL